MRNNISILYVEDDKDIAEEVAYFLEKKVFKFHMAQNGEEGLEIFKEFSPDIIITDIQMPKMDGLDMIKAIREVNSEIPIIIISAFNDSDKLLKAINLRVDAYLLKPINLLELYERVQKLMSPVLLKKERENSKQQLVSIQELEAKEKELKDYRERMDYAFTGSNDGLWDWNILTDEAYLSPRWKAILGYKDAEIQNHISSWENSVHPSDLPLAREELEKVFSKEKKLYEVEFRQMHKDGTVVWVLARGVVKFHENGNPIRMIGTHTDITQTKKVQSDLQESQESLATAQKIAHVGSWKWDMLTNKLEWSDEVFRIFGEDPHAFKADFDKFLSYIPQEDLKSVQQNLQNSLTNRDTPYDIVHRVIQKNGSQRYVHEKGEITYSCDGKASRMIGTIQDVTELKMAQEQLERLSITDELTKLYNRRHFNETISKELNRSQREKTNITFL